ncbi:MAG: DUF2384 domain-containing protein [Thiotrichaceae bacterium]|nr:DUF2384 domain-containing protein [Thiotrichaceae bacterium]
MKKYDKEKLLEVTGQVIAYLDQWKISADDIINILGLDIKTRHLPQYRKMEKSLPDTEETYYRVDHVVGIADALRTSYPFSDQMRVLWLHKPHRRFGKKSPMSVILQEGVDGLMRVRIEVDCAYGWAISDAMHAASNKV